MIREDRSPEFWTALIAHPDVAPHVTFGQTLDLGPLLENPWCVPLRSENGGFILIRLDGLGRVYELHSAYYPQAWGTREIVTTLASAVQAIFDRGAQMIVTYEVDGNKRSQPPKSFRFAPCGEFAPAPNCPQPLRTWALSRSAWEGSPVRLRMTA